MEVPDGTDLASATSALIKSLRRGREVEALYWAQQMEARYWRYVFRRLAVFATEDVGLADPQAVVIVASVRTLYEQGKTESRAPRPDGSLLSFVVLYLARAPKSREADDLTNAVGRLRLDEGWRPDVPAEAVDMHTAEGRAAMSEDDRMRHWFTEGSVLVGAVGPYDWKLWLRRWAVRQGWLDGDQVEAEAEAWDADGLLRYGTDGYLRRPEWDR